LYLGIEIDNYIIMKLFFTLLSFVLITSIFAQSTTARNNEVSNGSTTYRQVKILKTYPNPAVSYIFFDFNRSYSSGLSLEIYNLPGKKVGLFSNLQTSTRIDLQNYYRGIYIYKLIDRNSKVLESGKFQVSK
jgi:hypothetical protein